MHRELAAAMGYPVYPELAQAAGVAEDVHTSPVTHRYKKLWQIWLEGTYVTLSTTCFCM